MKAALNDLFDYCTAHSAPVQPVLNELERHTHLHTLYPQMLSGPYQGMLLQLISHMIQPRLALEIGAFTGYGSICLAQGLAEGGQLHTIEADDELAHTIHTYIYKAGLQDRITLHIGDAAACIPALEGPFDLVLLDAAKTDYLLHYELVLPKIRPGGFLLADNVLWSGKVLDPDTADPAARALQSFNNYVQQDQRVENLILPLRDGLLLARKRP